MIRFIYYMKATSRLEKVVVLSNARKPTQGVEENEETGTFSK